MHIIFTNEPTNEQIDELARADAKQQVICSVRTFYGEFYPIGENFLVSSNGTIDELGDFLRKYDVMPFAIRY